jgi:hypothetical protein
METKRRAVHRHTLIEDNADLLFTTLEARQPGPLFDANAYSIGKLGGMPGKS